MIVVDQLSITLGAFSLEDVSFTIPTGAYGVLMGRTGSGKTTILEAVIGLKRQQSGSIVLCGEDVSLKSPAARGVGYVPQDGALFSTMTVYDHLEFALSIRNVARDGIRERVQRLASLLQIEHLTDRYPRGLSGGERQRVALGRALSFEPKVLCLDEPLSALDESTRQDMVDLLRRVSRETGVTTLHVTHNPDEAEKLADTLLLLEEGGVKARGKGAQVADEENTEDLKS